VGETGPAKWARWRTDKNRPLPFVKPTILMEVESLRVGLLELLPDPMCECYRFSVQLKSGQNHSGCAGLFFLADEQRDADGPEHRFACLTIAEAGPQAGKVRLCCKTRRETEENPADALHTLRLREAPLEHQGEWHDLVVDVTPAELVFFCDGKKLKALSRADQETRTVAWWTLSHPGPSPSPPFAPRGALGLLVDDARFYFRNVVVIPSATPH
jgi:hypothetical protein